MNKISLVGIVSILALASVMLAATLTRADDGSSPIVICHRTGADHYLRIETTGNGWTGHMDHEGDIVVSVNDRCPVAKDRQEPL